MIYGYKWWLAISQARARWQECLANAIGEASKP